MNLRRRAPLLPGVACLAVALVACGSPLGSGGAAGPADGCRSGEAGMCVTVDITGAAAVRGTFQTTGKPGSNRTASCATWLLGEGIPRLQLILPGTLSKTVGGHQVGMANKISRYIGPNTYEGRDAVGSIDGGMHVDVDRTQYGATESAGSKVSARVAPDGSGTVTFTDLEELTNSSTTARKGRISGSYSWTCQD